MGIAEDLAIFVAGVGAGTLNAIVGSGSLITFPTLLAFGIPPVVANVSNNVGLVPGNASGAFGYRRELAGQRERTIRLAIVSVAGGVIGAVLLAVAVIVAMPPLLSSAKTVKSSSRARTGTARMARAGNKVASANAPP